MNENDLPSETPTNESPPFTTQPAGNPFQSPAGVPQSGPGGWGPPTTAPVAGPPGVIGPGGQVPNYSPAAYQPPGGPFGAGGYPAAQVDDGRIRTAYKTTDGLLGLIWAVIGFFGSLIMAFVPISIWLFTQDGGITSNLDESDFPTSVLAIATVLSQVIQGLWPLLVAKWLPGIKWSDLRVGFKLIDLLIGLGVAIIGVFAAGVAGWLASLAVGLENQEDASNTAFLTDAMGSPWFFLLVFAVVVGAPLSEEMFFRGLIMGSFENIGGGLATRRRAVSMDSVRGVAVTVGVIGSTLIFTAPHWIGGTAQETAVLFATIGTVGAVFGVAAVLTGRLASSMVAHALFNSVAVVAAIFTQSS